MVDYIYEKIKLVWKDSKPCQTIKHRVEMAGKRPLILYGAGRSTRAFLEACKELELPVVGICDTYLQGKYNEFDIINLDVLCQKYSDAVILVCSYSYNDEICKSLRQQGYGEEQIISCPVSHPYFTSPTEFLSYIDGYRWVYNFFDDEVSKQLVLDRMRMYILDEPMRINTKADRYYEKVISLGQAEVFVDAGAYVGDTAEEFIRKVNNQYTSVYSFEPSNENYNKAVALLKKYSNVEVIQKGLWSRNMVLSFYENSVNLAGSCIRTGNDVFSIEVVSLDDFFSDEKEKPLPSFIKMDVEGAEKEALYGSKRIIMSSKPKLAICAYHKIEDIYELPKTIKEIRSDYHYVLRQHSEGCFDMVLYAV